MKKTKRRSPAKTATKTVEKPLVKNKRPASNGSSAKKSTVKALSTNGKKAAKIKSKPRQSRAKQPKPIITENYRPTDAEPFMNERQLEYFKNKLLTWKSDIIRQTRETIEGLTAESARHADIADRATSETDRTLELRARDRQRKLVAKINGALARIEDGSYGYCEVTEEPINLRRLDARPIATLSIEAQERHERRERIYRND